MKINSRALSALLVVWALPAAAGEVDVVDAKARLNANGSYRFTVTLRHADAGWKHYADKWEVVGPNGKVWGRRVLLHPHDDEQPFTRALGRVRVPPGVGRVRVRGHDKLHGHGGKEMEVALPGRAPGGS